MTAAAPDYMRQRGFFDPDKNKDAAVTFVGCGGIGSFSAFAAAKLGIPKITLVDPDVVEAHNLPSQMFNLQHDGLPKVAALGAEIAAFTGEVPYMKQMFLAEMPTPSGVLVSGLDSMAARKELWEKHVQYNFGVPLLIDGRIDGQQIVIYSMSPTNPEDREKYEATLALTDEEVPAGLCTERAIIDVGFQIASQITRKIRKHYAGEKPDAITYVNMDDGGVIHCGW